MSSEQRHLGPREKARAGATLYWALEDINQRLEAEEQPRDDGFFDTDAVSGRARADELLEAVLVRAQQDHKERKLKHLGWLFSSIVFSDDVTPADAAYLIGLASRLTYGELLLVALFHRSAYRSLPDWQQLHPFEWRAHAVAGQLYELTQHGLLTRTDARPVRSYEDANPSELWVGVIGCRLYHLMQLDRVDEEALSEAFEELKAVSALETPWALISQLERYVDSEPLTEEDLDACRARVRMDDCSRSLLPRVGEPQPMWLRGAELAFRCVVLNDHAGGGTQLACVAENREEFQALLDEDIGRRLRLSPMPDGAVALD
jgi:hypothetical protein